jgi:high frequency lysogenization protein
MQHSKFDQTLALAGIYQAASLVKQLANLGKANNAQIESSIETLFRFDANTVEEVYGSVAGVIHGVKTLHQHLTQRNSRDIEITKYVISLIMLEKKLSRQPAMLDEISDRLNKVEEQFDFFALPHENTYTKIAEIYKDTISTLGPKIIVTGDRPYLSNNSNTNKVRSLLLAGIRSTVLWRQCGGSRWQFIFGRKDYINECDKIIATV